MANHRRFLDFLQHEALISDDDAVELELRDVVCHCIHDLIPALNPSTPTC